MNNDLTHSIRPGGLLESLPLSKCAVQSVDRGYAIEVILFFNYKNSIFLIYSHPISFTVSMKFLSCFLPCWYTYCRGVNLCVHINLNVNCSLYSLYDRQACSTALLSKYFDQWRLLSYHLIFLSFML